MGILLFPDATAEGSIPYGWISPSPYSQIRNDRAVSPSADLKQAVRSTSGLIFRQPEMPMPRGMSFVEMLMAKKRIGRQVEFPLDRAFTLVESGPVLLISTAYKGKSNLMTVSCSASMGFEPTLGISLGPWNFSYAALLETGECVVAIPHAGMLEKVVNIGNFSGEDMDKYAEFGLHKQPAKDIAAPLVRECLYNLECRVVSRALVEDYNFFVLQGVRAWRNPAPDDTRSFHAVGDGTFIIDGETVNLRDKMTKWQDCI
jgi:flavin reductase (DIM6/NTAB) family NADH-FMN oxidoreductase RutF